MNRDPENSEYCNYAQPRTKNCYMANNGSWYNEGCLLAKPISAQEIALTVATYKRVSFAMKLWAARDSMSAHI